MLIIAAARSNRSYWLVVTDAQTLVAEGGQRVSDLSAPLARWSSAKGPAVQR